VTFNLPNEIVKQVEKCLFVVVIQVFYHGKEVIDGGSYSTYGFSDLAIVIGAIAGSVVFLVWLVVSFKRYPTGIPFAASAAL